MKRPASFEARLRLTPQDEVFSSNVPHPEAPAKRASKDAGRLPEIEQ
ncbi:hypothetical protein EIB18_12940 [Caulobacter vibrioides]|uniref:Uncharacterized protein n=2 Tax=Caulobacter vibrioides TaxID=155892 RepID=A0A0H3IXT8_CAUVN|nr:MULTISPECIES: hypothetical protein [Caulobacter]YP_009020540.1 hypothetical protein CCNA_03968 [Caulobacter vibrioides NA1000]AHI88571.1 hypothetical protein CCNA_03968 [Caulobacter vibrioides NA1000]AVG21554.1 hypothetical protein CA608_20325 [Caulobacter vibrioides]AVH77089.1 hypothetical protein CA607_20475 [Caulobacter vibrioides]AWC68657.1 hypothetical protein CA606_20185 [Caulobacter vibrioides]AZH13525.1 hypothetical protein EIB18_12940 [Caulobacter vibrioides]